MTEHDEELVGRIRALGRDPRDAIDARAVSHRAHRRTAARRAAAGVGGTAVLAAAGLGIGQLSTVAPPEVVDVISEPESPAPTADPAPSAASELPPTLAPLVDDPALLALAPAGTPEGWELFEASLVGVGGDEAAVRGEFVFRSATDDRFVLLCVAPSADAVAACGADASRAVAREGAEVHVAVLSNSPDVVVTDKELAAWAQAYGPVAPTLGQLATLLPPDELARFPGLTDGG